MYEHVCVCVCGPTSTFPQALVLRLGQAFYVGLPGFVGFQSEGLGL